jgi:hypothetical protein
MAITASRSSADFSAEREGYLRRSARLPWSDERNPAETDQQHGLCHAESSRKTLCSQLSVAQPSALSRQPLPVGCVMHCLCETSSPLPIFNLHFAIRNLQCLYSRRSETLATRERRFRGCVEHFPSLGPQPFALSLPRLPRLRRKIVTVPKLLLQNDFQDAIVSDLLWHGLKSPAAVVIRIIC